MDKIDILRRARLFEMLSPAELEVLAELSKACHFVAGAVVFEEGEAGDCLYLVVSGEVEVSIRDSSGSGTSLVRLAPPEVFGEMSLVDKEPRSATVRAVTEVATLRLTAENFTTFRKHSRDGFTFVVMNIARVLSSRLRGANGKLAARTP